ncbi:DUF4446 family protein [bacterium]|nr:MAG: DUF4446 family protein [bacterium]
MEILQPFLVPMCLLALVLIIALFIWVAQLNSRLARQSKMVRQFFQGPEGEDLEGLLTRCMEVTQSSAERCENAESQVGLMSLQLHSCLQHFALVRYDAFGDVTGEQSFSIAFLDGNDNGVIVSSIFGRTNSRTFGKMIIGGQPEQTLSDEERQALLQALGEKAKKEGSK